MEHLSASASLVAFGDRRSCRALLADPVAGRSAQGPATCPPATHTDAGRRAIVVDVPDSTRRRARVFG